MDNATVSRLGQVNAANDQYALFRDQHTGVVLTNFQTATVMDGLGLTKMITAGKSATWHAIGDVTAAFHNAGVELDGQTVDHAERTITIKRPVISSIYVDQADLDMCLINPNSIYAQRQGKALAKLRDEWAIMAVIAGARQSAGAILTATPAGEQIVDADLGNSNLALETAQSYYTSIWEAVTRLQERDNLLPLHAVIRRRQFNALKKALAGQLGTGLDFDGSVRPDGNLDIGGCTVMASNNIPSTDLSSDTANYVNHALNYTATEGIVFTQEAFGTVKIRDIGFEVGWVIERDAYLMVAKMHLESDWLNPDHCIELKNA
jgi:hypothetical protein